MRLLETRRRARNRHYCQGFVPRFVSQTALADLTETTRATSKHAYLQRFSDGETRTRTGDTTIFRRTAIHPKTCPFAGLLCLPTSSQYRCFRAVYRGFWTTDGCRGPKLRGPFYALRGRVGLSGKTRFAAGRRISEIRAHVRARVQRPGVHRGSRPHRPVPSASREGGRRINKAPPYQVSPLKRLTSASQQAAASSGVFPVSAVDQAVQLFAVRRRRRCGRGSPLARR